MKSLRKLLVVTLVVMLAIMVGVTGITQLPVHVQSPQSGSSYLADVDPPFLPPPTHNSILPTNGV